MLLVYDFWNDYLLTPERIIGLSLIIIGIVVALVSKRLTRVITKQSEIDKENKTYTKVLITAFVLIIVGMIVAIL